MVLLDKLLSKLEERDSRLLIFSQVRDLVHNRFTRDLVRNRFTDFEQTIASFESSTLPKSQARERNLSSLMKLERATEDMLLKYMKEVKPFKLYGFWGLEWIHRILRHQFCYYLIDRDLYLMLGRSASMNVLSVIPKYPMVNFILTTAIYVAVSHRIFLPTNKLKLVFLSTGDKLRLVSNMISAAAIFSLSLYALSWLLLHLPKLHSRASQFRFDEFFY